MCTIRAWFFAVGHQPQQTHNYAQQGLQTCDNSSALQQTESEIIAVLAWDDRTLYAQRYSNSCVKLSISCNSAHQAKVAAAPRIP